MFFREYANVRSSMIVCIELHPENYNEKEYNQIFN